MTRFPWRSAVIVLVLLWLPAAAHAQGAITGVAKDASGGVLPGVTVEAASPVLIEKVRSVVTDATGQYRIVDLRPGTYSVTFSLPGFSTVKRDGIELTGTFVATVNGDLKVGALEETITVTGETPIVDVQSAKVQQSLSKDVLAAIPTSRNATGIQALIPGLSTATDSGGISGAIDARTGTIHGGHTNDSRTYQDGINTGWAGGDAGSGNMTGNAASVQEMVVTTSGGLGEAETSGVVLNAIPRDGSNTFSGSFFANGANGSMQGSNYTQALQDQGLKTPSELLKLWDLSPAGGGRIIRDRLWFYTSYRETRAESTVPGMWFNKNAGNPNAWTVDFDLSRQAFSDNVGRNAVGRITWQVSPRNKINLHWSEQYKTNNTRGGGTGTTTPEATVWTKYGPPSHVQQATWSSPVTSRILLEAGWGTYQARYRNWPRVDGSFNPRMIQTVEQAGTIPGLTFRAPLATNGGYYHNLIGTLANNRASISYVTGAQNMKFGYQGGFNNPSQTISPTNEILSIRMQNGVINQLRQGIVATGAPTSIKYVRNLWPTSFYAQDQWTRDRLTLQGGVRYDHIHSNYPESRIGGEGFTAAAAKEIVYPSRSTPGVSWNDITPRVGVAYDLFGNGKTAVKFNLGKYMEAFSANNADLDLNPLIRTTLSTTRLWTDSNKDFVPNCDLSSPLKNGECGVMDDQNLGKEKFTRSFDPAFISGWGVRTHNWGLGLSVQQELFPRVSINVGYIRNWWGNWYAIDNRSTVAADYTPFSIVTPQDSRLPGGGGQTIGNLYNLIPTKVGLVDELAQESSNFAKQIENWQGVDVSVSARLRNGLTVQGGTSTGRRLSDACALKAALPEQAIGSIAGGSLTNPYCRVSEPYQTQLRGLATYTVPRIDVQVSGTWSITPGPQLAANYTVTNAIANVGPQPLGRNLSSGSVTVNLIEPGTFYADRRTNIDFRIAKLVRYRRTRTQIGLDIYNLTNTDVVTSYNQNFVAGGAWLTPTGIQPARYVKIGAQFDF